MIPGPTPIAERAMLRGEALASTDRSLLAPSHAPMLFDSSPHVVRWTWLAQHLGWTPRRQLLLQRLSARLDAMRDAGVLPVCALVGGSFAGFGDAPKDLDALILYRAAGGADAIVAALRPVTDGLDLRFVPDDADPILLIKMTCFFHTLYQGIDKGNARGSVLVLFSVPSKEA